ncbi:hypothetical protein BT96DRAFT_1009287 [Gymnopus androsaceus JB14]|uniref:Uncharacterized protein n=1 Tax=Gymnopus androsaceus JB14 TaxID=1447944 RepID=A0A6A4GCX1_9AGAR|nr:hypothetical protein BT96DRAFT_1009287 [Gymnopus androsaceus JB14]
MATHSSSDDTVTKITLNEDIAADIIRLQGEEVIRLRKELEDAQKLNTTAFDLLRSTDEYMSEMQNTFHQRRTQLSFLEGTLVDLQRENAASSHTLEDMQADLRNLCGFLSSEQSSSHPVTQDNIVDERYKSSSIAGSTRDEFVMIDDLSTEASITNISTTDSDVESNKPIAQLYSSMVSPLH